MADTGFIQVCSHSVIWAFSPSGTGGWNVTPTIATGLAGTTTKPDTGTCSVGGTTRMEKVDSTGSAVKRIMSWSMRCADNGTTLNKKRATRKAKGERRRTGSSGGAEVRNDSKGV